MNKKDLSVSTGFSTLSIASLAYNIHLKADISNELDKKNEQLLFNINKIIEKRVNEILEIERDKLKNEIYNEILLKLKKEDDWEKRKRQLIIQYEIVYCK